MAKYLVRQRQFIQLVRTMYGRKASYGKWVTLGRFNEIEHAMEFRTQNSRIGLQQTVVTLRGRVVIDTSGAEVR